MTDETKKEEVNAPCVNAGSGGIAGLGVGPEGEPGGKKKNKHILMTFRRWANSINKTQ